MDQMMEDRLITNFSEFLGERTLVLVTHKPTMLRLCNRVVVIEGGQIKFDDTKENYMNLVKVK
jgi:ATP-binding cassette subfamily C protein LapB